MIKEVIFDIDDTLYDYEKGHAAGVRQMQEYAEQELGVSGEEFEREYRRQHADIKKRLVRMTRPSTAAASGFRICWSIGKTSVSPCDEAVSCILGYASCGERAGAGQH